MPPLKLPRKGRLDGFFCFNIKNMPFHKALPSGEGWGGAHHFNLFSTLMSTEFVLR